MPRQRRSTVRVQRDTYQRKGKPPTNRWRVFVHHRSPAGELTRKSFLAPEGASRALADALGHRMLADLQAADDTETRAAVQLARRLRARNPREPLAPTTTLPTTKTTPTVTAFSERYMVDFCEANRQAHATLTRKRIAFKLHINPVIGDVPLWRVTGEHVQRVKAQLADYSARSVNTVLGVLRAMLRVAEEWNVIAKAPKVRMVNVHEDEPDWFEPDEYQALCGAAAAIDLRTLALVLLGGDAGLRRGEMMALKWTDVDTRHNRVIVRASRSRKGEKPPKNGKTRSVPMTDNLRLTLQALRAEPERHAVYVLWTKVRRSYPKGKEPLCPGLPAEGTLRNWLMAAADRADITPKCVHALRHTFCSDLGDHGVEAATIKALAGHSDLRMTNRYVHVRATAPADGIRALDRAPLFGDKSKNRAKTPEPTPYPQ